MDSYWPLLGGTLLVTTFTCIVLPGCSTARFTAFHMYGLLNCHKSPMGMAVSHNHPCQLRHHLNNACHYCGPGTAIFSFTANFISDKGAVVILKAKKTMTNLWHVK